jgi:mono/diheme cytochrome c family protein
LNDRYFFDQRLQDVQWTGTLEDYIVSSASSGRLSSTRPDVYPGQGTPAMPSFSQQFGGPLREDQIRNIAAFVMNWEATAEFVEVPPAPTGPIVGTDITKELPEGDPASGEAISISLACTACHVDAPTGPFWPASEDSPGIGDRAATRITQPDYSGEASTADQYLFESIVNPSIHLITGYADGLMPNTYGSTLTDQEMADLIAYLLSIK